MAQQFVVLLWNYVSRCRTRRSQQKVTHEGRDDRRNEQRDWARIPIEEEDQYNVFVSGTLDPQLVEIETRAEGYRVKGVDHRDKSGHRYRNKCKSGPCQRRAFPSACAASDEQLLR